MFIGVFFPRVFFSFLFFTLRLDLLPPSHYLPGRLRASSPPPTAALPRPRGARVSAPLIGLDGEGRRRQRQQRQQQQQQQRHTETRLERTNPDAAAAAAVTAAARRKTGGGNQMKDDECVFKRGREREKKKSGRRNLVSAHLHTNTLLPPSPGGKSYAYICLEIFLNSQSDGIDLQTLLLFLIVSAPLRDFSSASPHHTLRLTPR